MEYKLIIGHGFKELEAKVNESLNDGWELQGGATTAITEVQDGLNVIQTISFIQAVCKRS